MIDASWSRPGFAVVVIIAVIIPVIRHAQRQVTEAHEKKMDEVRRLVVNGQRELLTEFRTLVELTRMEYELRYCGDTTAREPAEAAEQTMRERIAAIVAEIQASPYQPDQVRSDLPEEVSDLAVLHRDGPVAVHGPAAPEPRRYRRGTLNGLAAVPVVGALFRGFTAMAQGTAALSSATVGSAAMATMALAPAPAALASDQPSAIAVTLPGQDTHLPAVRRQIPAAPGAPLPIPSRTPTQPDDAAEAETVPVPPGRPPAQHVRPPLVSAPTPTQTPTPEPTVLDDDPEPALPTPTTTSPDPSPASSGSPPIVPSPSPSQRVAPSPSGTTLGQTELSA